MESELHVVPWNHKWYIPICQVWLKLYTWFRQGKHVNSLHLGRQQKQQQGLISKSNLHATWAFISEKNTSFGFDLFLQDLSMLIFFLLMWLNKNFIHFWPLQVSTLCLSPFYQHSNKLQWWKFVFAQNKQETVNWVCRTVDFK